MNVLKTLQQKGGFTRKEAVAVLALSATFLVGMGIKWWQSNQHNNQPPPTFDYSRSDSIYTALAQSAQTSKPTSSRAPFMISEAKPRARINLNTATKAQLMALPGIGPSYAERIIAYREQRGAFTSVDELLAIKGIGKKKLEKIRPYVYVK